MPRAPTGPITGSHNGRLILDGTRSTSFEGFRVKYRQDVEPSRVDGRQVSEPDARLAVQQKPGAARV